MANDYSTKEWGKYVIFNMTRSQINHSYESGRWMKVKVAKCCWKK